MADHEQAAIKKFTLLVLFQAQEDRASELFIRAADFDSPIEYKVQGKWYALSRPPRHVIPKVLTELANLAGLHDRGSSAEGNIDIPFSGGYLRWRIRLSNAGANCFPLLP